MGESVSSTHQARTPQFNAAEVLDDLMRVKAYGATLD